jgi:hypothetical protein
MKNWLPIFRFATPIRIEAPAAPCNVSSGNCSPFFRVFPMYLHEWVTFNTKFETKNFKGLCVGWAPPTIFFLFFYSVLITLMLQEHP